MKVFSGVDEIADAVGTLLGYSEWHEVTQAQVDAFADVTGDHQWIHVDRERAATGPYGGTIAHGYLTLSLVPRFLAEIYRLEGFSASINYGADKVRFLAPVVTGSRLRGRLEVTGLDRTPPERFLLRLRVTIEIDGGDKPACAAEILVLLVPETSNEG